MLALAQSLNAEILGSHSATDSLEKWCRRHQLAQPATIVAKLDATIVKPATAEQRRRLKVSEQEQVSYRHVRLLCGDHVLSEADNWYVPGRLTDEMNRLLETTDIPFGRAVQALAPYRQTFATISLWPPLAAVWGRGPAVSTRALRPLAIPDSLFEHRALLYGRDDMPFSEVDEVYKRWLLEFPAVRP